MKRGNKILFWAACLVISAWLGQGVFKIQNAWAVNVNTTSAEKQALTRTDPNNSQPTGRALLNLNHVKKVRVSLLSCTDVTCVATGGNLTGGTVEIWYTHIGMFASLMPLAQVATNAWLPNPDLFLTVGSPGQPGRVWADLPSWGGNSSGTFMMARANGVTLASGTGLMVVMEGITDD